jgi:hypothetical protein
LGFVPEGDSAPTSTERALAGRLIQQVGEELKDEPARMISALKAFHHAKELVAKEGGVPRIALAASVLLEIADSPEGHAKSQSGQKARQMLMEAGADEETIRGVAEILDHFRSGRKLDGIEFKIVCDADRLAKLTTEYSPDQREEVEVVIQEQLATATARERARSWCKSVDGESQ